MTFRCQQVSFPQEAYGLVCRSDLNPLSLPDRTLC